MNAIDTTTHDFYGQQITLIERGGEGFVLLDQLCNHMSIEREPQRKNLARQIWAKGMTSVMEVMLPGEFRAYPRTVLNVKILGMWLANITTSRIKDDHARQMVERYQVELTQKIHEWLTKPAQAALSEDEIVHQALAITARRVEQLEAKITADAPKVHFAEAVAASPSTILVGDLAKILRANGAPFGANRLFEKLRTDGYLIRRRGSDWNMPTQKSMELGLFEIKESTRQHPDGHVLLTKTPKVTGKGQQYFIEKYAPLDQLDLGGTAA